MPGEDGRSITAALSDHVGDRLRGIARYGDREYEVVYLRDDVKADRLKSEVDDMVVRLQRESRTEEEAAFPFGAYRATVRFFEDALVVHVPHEDGQGLLVTVDPDATAELAPLVEACIAGS